MPQETATEIYILAYDKNPTYLWHLEVHGKDVNTLTYCKFRNVQQEFIQN